MPSPKICHHLHTRLEAPPWSVVLRSLVPRRNLWKTIKNKSRYRRAVGDATDVFPQVFLFLISFPFLLRAGSGLRAQKLTIIISTFIWHCLFLPPLSCPNPGIRVLFSPVKHHATSDRRVQYSTYQLIHVSLKHRSRGKRGVAGYLYAETNVLMRAK